MATSPDALLVGDGRFKALSKVKCACPYIDKDDGRGWVWSPFMPYRNAYPIYIYALCAVPSLDGGCPGQPLLTCWLGC